MAKKLLEVHPSPIRNWGKQLRFGGKLNCTHGDPSWVYAKFQP